MQEDDVRIVVDHDRSTGLGMCEAEAPRLFEVQGDGTLVLVPEAPSEDQRLAAQAAVDSCPTDAFALVED